MRQGHMHRACAIKIHADSICIETVCIEGVRIKAVFGRTNGARGLPCWFTTNAVVSEVPRSRDSSSTETDRSRHGISLVALLSAVGHGGRSACETVAICETVSTCKARSICEAVQPGHSAGITSRTTVAIMLGQREGPRRLAKVKAAAKVTKE